MAKISIFERHPRKTLICFLLVSVLILDFLTANVYRFLKGYPWVYRNERIERTFRIWSKYYNHDLAAKKIVHEVSWGPNVCNYYTNSLGFRDKSTRDISLIPDKQRIVFIGDSFTEGVGFDYEDTFVGLVDEALSKKGIEVLNAGVVSYSPIIYWKKIKYLIENVGLKFDQLIVFLDISDAEDEAKYYRLGENENIVGYAVKAPDHKNNKFELENEIKKYIKSNSILTYTISYNLYGVFFPVHASEGHRGDWTIDNKLYQEYGEDGLHKMQLHMDKLYELLNKNNIKLTVAVYPWTNQIIHNDLNSIQVTFWRDWCRRYGVNFINYFPYFVTGITEKDRKLVIDKYFIKGDVHLNKKGNKLIADIFLADYENKK